MFKAALITVTLLAAIFGGNCIHLTHSKVQQTLTQLILRSTAAMQTNSMSTSECFDKYLPPLVEVTDEYEQAHESCLNNTADAYSNIEGEVKPDRTEVEITVEGICSEFQQCSINSNNSYDFFQCNYNYAPNATVAAYNVQVLSKDRMDYIAINHKLIMYNQDKCTDKCNNEYVEKSSVLFDALEKCLNNRAAQPNPEPTSTTVSSSSTPEDSTMESSSSTTENSSTDSITGSTISSTVTDSDSTTDSLTTEETEASTDAPPTPPNSLRANILRNLRQQFIRY